MSIDKVKIFGFILWGSIFLTLLSPFLSNFFSIPRLDTMLMPFYGVLTLLFFSLGHYKGSILFLFSSLVVMVFFSFISLVLNYSFDNFVDISFFSFFLFLFLFSCFYLSRCPLGKIRKILFFLSMAILLGFFLEIIFGVQLVQGGEQLSVLDGAFKGFFFNTNDQAVVVTALCTAISFFYILNENNYKTKILGYVVLFFLGVVVFVCASRASLVAYILIIAITIFLNSNNILRYVYGLTSCLFLFFFLNLSYLKPILNFLSGFSWLERSVQRLELVLFAFDEDNSIGYRTEIYQKFFENFKLIFFGYGPRNYEQYFNANPLSYPLGYTNPHSFFIEIYLAFGIFAFLSFIVFLVGAVVLVFLSKNVVWEKKFFFLFSVLVFCWLVWVPSSILRLPLIWYPIFLMLIYILTANPIPKNTVDKAKLC